MVEEVVVMAVMMRVVRGSLAEGEGGEFIENDGVRKAGHGEDIEADIVA